MVILNQFLAVSLSLLLVTPQTQTPPAAASAPSPQELQQLVAPIALYPDALVAQILAGATYPTQVVEAQRWIQQNANLKPEQRAAEVDKQPWDPSIKALTEFPSVLDNMNKNLSWTSSLGDAYFNDPDGVISAVQALRAEAQNAGTLKSTPEQTVTTEGQTIIIQPSDPQVVYVPEYSPAVVYGTAIEPYPGYSGWDVAAASMIGFGVGTAVGAAMGGWGWGHWGMDWHGGNVNFNRNAYVSRSNTFANRNTRYNQANRAGRVGGGAANRGAAGSLAGRNKPSAGQGFGSRSGGAASRGFGQAGQGSRGTGGNTFSGFGYGGSARSSSSRGKSSFGGGGRSAGGGGRS